MGYSARYHAASLAAVFLALVVGLLIGAEFGDEVVSGTAENLEESLKGDLEDAEARISDLEAELATQERFAAGVYPALVGEQLIGRDLALVALGSRSDALREDVLEALVDAIGGKGLSGPKRQREDHVARKAGRGLATGSGAYERGRDALLSGFSGRTGPVDGIVVVRERPELEGNEEAATQRFEDHFLEGLLSAEVPVVGIERSDADPSSVGFFDSHGLSTVDAVDLFAGRVAMVYALRGARGNFGVGEEADALLPELLDPPRLPGP